MSHIHRHFVFIVFALVVNPLIGWSHPGHGAAVQAAEELSAAHYLIEPVHSLPIIAAIAVVLLLTVALARVGRLVKRPASPAR